MPFSRAVDALFGAFGVVAAYHAGPAGDALAVTVVARQNDGTRTAFAPGAQAPARVFDLRAADVAEPKRGDMLVWTPAGAAAAERLRVMRAERDQLGLVWTLDLELIR